MALTKASKSHKCKRGHTINKGDQYYPQRRNKSLCWNCGQPVNLLLRWAFNQVRISNG
ncbi:MAG: hypothetical protein MJK15_05200 [Colwellia sp.]|nr:hypothetical protein [Colwellia sp.]